MIPYILSGLGVGAILVALTRPQRRTLLLLWGCMGVVALGSLIGMVEHIESNLGFYLEIHPATTGLALLTAGLRGASPLLAPGVLALGAVLAVAAAYQHPAFAPGGKG
ncbi:MAG: hypothetical protein HY326_06115 [Chloroflexi bacterium]|nr:hypothetical protein [Chloroflexota bacterium]